MLLLLFLLPREELLYKMISLCMASEHATQRGGPQPKVGVGDLIEERNCSEHGLDASL